MVLFRTKKVAFACTRKSDDNIDDADKMTVNDLIGLLCSCMCLFQGGEGIIIVYYQLTAINADGKISL